LVDLPPAPADPRLDLVELAFLDGEVDNADPRQQLRLADCGVGCLDLIKLLLLERICV
jgi:hypothetical protein